MMRRAIAAMLLTAAAAVLAACSTEARVESGGPTVERSYTVGPFERIELAGAYDATVTTGGKPGVRAKGDEKLIEQLVVEVQGDKLSIHPRERHGFRWGWGKRSKVELTITVPGIREATLAGAGAIRIDRVRGEAFEGTVAGSGELALGAVEVNSLKLQIAGSGDARAGPGKARSAEYEIAGSGDVDAAGVTAETLKVSIAGSGNVRANATGSAEVDIMGSGDVSVSGGAKCKVSKAGSGRVHCS